MQIYFINLDRSPERRAHMESQFEALGLNPVRVSAVDAQTDALPGDSRWRWLRPTEIACLLSHKRCWERIAADDRAFGVVFEDDVTLSPAAATLLNSDWRLPKGVDILKVETFFRDVRASVKLGDIDAGFAHRRLYSLHIGSAGYAVSRAAAARLVQILSTGPLEPADSFLFSPQGAPFRSLSVCQLDPAICVQSHQLGDHRFPTTIAYWDQMRRRIGRWDRIFRELRKLRARIVDRWDAKRRETLTIPYAARSAPEKPEF